MEQVKEEWGLGFGHFTSNYQWNPHRPGALHEQRLVGVREWDEQVGAQVHNDPSKGAGELKQAQEWSLRMLTAFLVNKEAMVAELE